MKRRLRPNPADRRRYTQLLADLAVPVPFSIPDFQVRLADYSGRRVEVRPAALTAGAPSGIWLRANGTDYLYYEKATSPFHQAHIVLHLAAHLLLSDAPTGIFDERLTSEVSQELIQLMLGETAPSPISLAQADAFAFAALESACQVSWLAATRALRQLAPLHRGLLGAVPGAYSPDHPGADPRRRLYRVVIEIRDATLALRPYCDPQAATTPQADNIGAEQAAAENEAVVLARAIATKAAGRMTNSEQSNETQPFPAAPDLGSEIAWLARVSKAFGRCWPGDQTGHGQRPRITPDGERRSDT